MLDKESYFTITEVAEQLGYSRQSIWLKYKNGLFEGARLIGHQILIPKTGINKFVAKSQRAKKRKQKKWKNTDS
jgi:hypothetical protein